MDACCSFFIFILDLDFFLHSFFGFAFRLVNLFLIFPFFSTFFRPLLSVFRFPQQRVFYISGTQIEPEQCPGVSGASAVGRCLAVGCNAPI